MAPKVCVPADFGRHHIGAPSHGNLTFNLGEGVKIRANSIILSLNSPVIDELTTNLHQTSLEADDFSREAVDCFIESTYTGEIEAVNLGNFRDVNKMSRVFQVSWLVAKCEEYFVSYLDKLDSESSYSDMLFVVEEAVYLMSAIKSRDFLDLVVTQMNKISAAFKNGFVQNYLSDLSKSSLVKIDACLDILQSDVHIMIELLISHVEDKEIENLDKNTRHLLKNADLITCGRDHPDILKKLFDVLENVQCVEREDFQLLLGITRQMSIQPQQKICNESSNSLSHRYLVTSNYAETRTAGPGTISVNFLEYPKYLMSGVQSSIVVENLGLSTNISNLYTLIDGLWSRLYQGSSGFDDSTLISEIVALKKRHGWGLLNPEYVNRLYFNCDTIMLIDPLSECEKLVSGSSKLCKAVICPYLSAEQFVEQFFLKDSSFTFSLSDSRFANQEFVLKTTAVRDNNPDSFTMNYGMSDSDVELSAYDLPKLHFAIEIRYDDEILPLSWCGKPTCDVTKTYWNWGYIQFHDKDMSDLEMTGDFEHQFAKQYSISKWRGQNCRLVAYSIPGDLTRSMPFCGQASKRHRKD